MDKLKYKLVAVIMALLFCAHALADTAKVPFIYKAMGVGLLANGVAHTLGKCKHGVVDSTETDPITGISKPTKVCASAPAQTPDGYWEDYSKLELANVMLSTRKLSKNMDAAGESRQTGCARHHIVPQKDNKIPENEDIRKILSSCGIDINDAINGVNLPHNSNATCEGSKHRSLHTAKYYFEVADKVIRGLSENGCDGVKSALKILKNDLLTQRLGPQGY